MSASVNPSLFIESTKDESAEVPELPQYILQLLHPSQYSELNDTTLYSTAPVRDETGVLGVVGVVGELTGGGGGGELVVQKFVLTPPVRIPSSIRTKKTQLMIRSKLMTTPMHRPTPIMRYVFDLRLSFFTGGETMGSTFGAFRPPACLALGGNAHGEELRGLAVRALSSSAVASSASAGGGASESTFEPRSTSSASLASGVCDTDESVDSASDAEDDRGSRPLLWSSSDITPTRVDECRRRPRMRKREPGDAKP